jgi:HEPN domain-containing protein
MEHDIWFYRAQQDWKTINRLIDSGPWSHVSFHAQQAAEKCLKGYLTFKSKNPPKIHDLLALLDFAKSFDPSLDSLIEECDALNRFAVNARYEEFEDSFDEAAAREAVEAAKHICTAIRERIPYDIPY